MGLIKGRVFGSPLTRGLKPRASTAEIPPGFAVLVREAKRAGKPGASSSFLRLPNQGGALVAVKLTSCSNRTGERSKSRRIIGLQRKVKGPKPRDDVFGIVFGVFQEDRFDVLQIPRPSGDHFMNNEIFQRRETDHGPADGNVFGPFQSLPLIIRERKDEIDANTGRVVPGGDNHSRAREVLRIQDETT